MSASIVKSQSATRPPTAMSEDKFKKRERILVLAGKLNDKDTQVTASKELREALKSLDQENLVTLLSTLCSTPANQTQAKKEAIKLVRDILDKPITSCTIPLPYFLKILAFYKSCIKDKEPRIRDLAAEAIGALAGSSRFFQTGCTTNDVLQTPVLKVILEVLSDQKREIQTAASTALTQYINAVRALPLRAAKQVVKYLNAPNFLAKGSLITAIGRCTLDNTELAGLVAQPISNWITLVPDILGLDTSSGLVGAMQSPDWQTRRAAVDCLRSIIVSAGPTMSGSISPTCEAESTMDRIISSLQKLKFDKVKSVRDSVIDAVSLLECLKVYEGLKEPTKPWNEWLDSTFPKKAERSASPWHLHGCMQSPLNASDTSARTGGTLSRPGSALRALRERQRRQASDNGRSQGASGSFFEVLSPPLTSTGGTEGEYADICMDAAVSRHLALKQQNVESGDTMQSSDEAGTLLETSNTPHPRHKDEHDGRVGRTPRRTWQLQGAENARQESTHLDCPRDLSQQVAKLEEQNTYLLSLMDRLTTSVTRSLSELESRISILENSSQNRNSASCCLQGDLLTHEDAEATAGPPTDDPTTPEFQTGDKSWSHQEFGGRRTDQSIEISTSMSSVTPCSPNVELEHVSPSNVPITTDNSVSLDGAYLEAMRSSQGGLRLLRLMQKTGPVWTDLQADVAMPLLSAIESLLASNTQLHRLLPWLWALADEDSCAKVPFQARQQLLTCLEQLALSDEDRQQFKLDILVSTLKAAWGVSPDSVPPSPIPVKRSSFRQSISQVGTLLREHTSVSDAPPPSRNAQVAASAKSLPRASLESLAIMQAELSQLESRFSQLSPVK
eukprot:jgi/Botrbrau1/11572/Bobra.60_1s0023.2